MWVAASISTVAPISAPYELVRREFDLPDEAEPFPEKSYPNAAVLVRGLEYGPGIGMFEDGPGFPM